MYSAALSLLKRVAPWGVSTNTLLSLASVTKIRTTPSAIFCGGKIACTVKPLARYKLTTASVAFCKSSKLTDYEREHVSPYFYNNKKKYKIFNFNIKNDLSKYNLTIDFKDDLIFFNKIIKKIKYNKINFSYRNILKFIRKNEN